jgi:hypothetical protein
VKLFQIEEPDGTPPDPQMPGVAIGIDAAAAEIEVAFSVGGNPAILVDRSGFERGLSVPDSSAGRTEWQQLFEAARIRAERALARPVSHAVIVSAAADPNSSASLREAAVAAGLTVLRVIGRGDLPPGANAALTAAILAEDLAPRPA